MTGKQIKMALRRAEIAKLEQELEELQQRRWEMAVKQKDVEVGKVYLVTVTGLRSPVKLIRENAGGGWDGVNLRTNKAVRVRSHLRLQRELDAKMVEFYTR